MRIRTTIRPRFPRPLRAGWLVVQCAGATWLAGGGCGSGARAAEIPDLPAPFADPAVTGAEIAVDDTAWAAVVADRAVANGFFHLAEGVYRRQLADLPVGTPLRERVALGLVTALIGQGKPADAAEILDSRPQETSAPWMLRRAMVDALQADYAALAEHLQAADVARLPEADVAWWHFLQAVQEDHALNTEAADEAFAQALATSTSTAAAAWFATARFQLHFNAGEADADALDALRERMRTFAGQPQGFEAGLQYAALLERLGRAPEAVQELQRLRAAVPASQPDLRDRTRLLLGLIAGVQSPEGWEALLELLEDGNNPAWRRIALQRLAAGPEARVAGLGRVIDTLLAQADQPLAEELYFYGAALALRRSEQVLVRVREYVEPLLTRFPGSSLTAGARAMLASAAWQSQYYRVAADNVARMRDELPADAAHASERTRLAVLLGECHYQAARQAGVAEDYRNAAQAYGTAQEELHRLEQAEGVEVADRLAGASLGTVFFKRVLATLRGGNLDQAGQLVVGEEAAQVDADSRWRAAWNVVRFLQLNGRPDDAFGTIEQLNAETAAPPDLRLRFLWLAAQLTLETERPGPAATAARADAVLAFLATDEGRKIDAARRAEVESATVMLKAQASLGLAAASTDPAERERLTAAGFADMEKLRTDYRGSNAAVYSYITQAGYLAEAGQLVAAQRLLQDLVAQYPESVYAPLALFEAAELSVKRGGDTYLKEALDLLNALLKSAEQSEQAKNYVFIAVLKQGDISRELRRFAEAEQAYLYLENTFPDHPDIAVARLRLAGTMLAQVAENPAKFDPAITLLERLTDLPSADVGLRAEAGFQLGYAWENHGDPARAAEIYWGLYLRFLQELPPGASPLGGKANYWIARALLQFAELEMDARRPANAQHAYQIWLDRNLPGSAIARDRLRTLQEGG